MAHGRNARTIVLFAVMILLPAVLHAQEVPADPNEFIELPDLLGRAAMESAELKTAFYDWKTAVAAVPQAEALPDPRFSYGYFIHEVETRVGPQQHRVSLSQTFPWFGKIEARTDAAAAQARAAYQRYEAAKLSLFQSVKDAFYEYAYLSRAIEIAQENAELLSHFEQVARTRYAAAAATHPDVIRAQIELALVLDQLQTLLDMRPAVAARLNAALNRSASAPLAWPRPVESPTVEIADDSLIAMLVEKNPRLEALRHETAAAEQRIELARKQFYPDITAGVDWIQTDDAAMAVDDSGKDPVIATFSINIPLWADSYRAAVRQARMQKSQVAARRVQTEYDLAARAVRTRYDYIDARRKAALYRDTLIPRARQMLRASESAYMSGSVDFLSLIDAQRKLLQFELLFARSRANALQSLARLEELTATQFPVAGLANPVPASPVGHTEAPRGSQQGGIAPANGR